MGDDRGEPTARHRASCLDDLDHGLDDGRRLASIEKRHIQLVLREVHGNKTEAARQLGIGLTTLYRKVQEYGLG